MPLLKPTQTDFTDATQQFLILIKWVTTDFNSLLQWYVGENGLNVNGLKRSGFCPNISLEKPKLMLTVKLFFVMGSMCKTKNFAKLLKRVLIANKIGLNGEYLSRTFLNSRRKYVEKILNNFWPVLTMSPFSPLYHWRKLLKSVATHFIRIKSCCVTSVKISLRNF